MVSADGSDDGSNDIPNDVSRIFPPAKSGFQHNNLTSSLHKCHKRYGSLELKNSRQLFPLPLHVNDGGSRLRNCLRQQLPVDKSNSAAVLKLDTFLILKNNRRHIPPCQISVDAENTANISGSRAFAVRSRNMNKRQFLLRIIETGTKLSHPLQSQ